MLIIAFISWCYESDKMIYVKCLVSSKLMTFFAVIIHTFALESNNLCMPTDNTQTILLTSHQEYGNALFALCPFLLSF